MVNKPLTLIDGIAFAHQRRMTDEDLAAHLAQEAGLLLLEQRTSSLLEGAALGHVADKVANAFILTGLAEWRPGDAVLSEESFDDRTRLDHSRVWIIDPLDGTREYAEGRDDWAVHVALVENGLPIAGAVALPALGLTLTSADPAAIVALNAPPRVLVSRTRPAAEAVAVAEAMGAELVGMGSAGAKAMAVVRGEADIYLHTGGQYEWDSCAPAAVARAAGLHVSRIDGSPLVYNGADAWMPDLLICRREHASAVLAHVGAGQ